MKRKTRIFITSNQKWQETNSEAIQAHLNWLNEVKISEFLSSKLTYTEWIESFCYKLSANFERSLNQPIIVDGQHRYQAFFPAAINAIIQVKQKLPSIYQRQLQLWTDAQELLFHFKQTKNEQYLFEFKKLIGEYYTLIQRVNVKLKKIVGRLKALLRKDNHIDLRERFRKRNKMISKNTDDENYGVSNQLQTFFSKSNIYPDGYTYHRNYHSRLGVLYR